MIKLIIEMVSKLTDHKLMYPITPISMETIEKATQKAQAALGINSKLITIITKAAILFCIASNPNNST